MSNNELLEALNILEQEKNISKDTLLEAIENSLVTACKNHFGRRSGRADQSGQCKDDQFQI